MVKADTEFRKTCIWCIAAAVALIPLALVLIWFLLSAD
jgi:hypothetical protein